MEFVLRHVAAHGGGGGGVGGGGGGGGELVLKKRWSVVKNDSVSIEITHAQSDPGHGRHEHSTSIVSDCVTV